MQFYMEMSHWEDENMNYIFYKDQLQGKYLEVFDKVELYSQLKNISGDMSNEMMMELLDMLLMAQKEKKPVEKIVGKDVEKFCHNYFSEYSWKNRLQEMAKRFYTSMWFIFVMEMLEIIFMLGDADFHLLTATTDVSGYLVGFLTSATVFTILDVIATYFLFRWKRFSVKLYNKISFALLVIASIGIICFFNVENLLLNLPVFPVVLFSGGYIFIYFIIRSIWRWKWYGSIRKAKEPGEVSMGTQIMEEVRKTLPFELRKRYERKNKGRIRRKKALMTPEEFTEVIRKENKFLEKFDQYFAFVVFAIILAASIYEMITNEVIEGMLFFLILCIAEIPALLWAHAMKRGDQIRNEIIAACDEQEITIIEYVNRLEAAQKIEGEKNESETQN